MKHVLLLLAFSILGFGAIAATPLSEQNETGWDFLRNALIDGSSRQVQEKVYIQTDNSCYFVGDTLWYKAFVVRADNLHMTNLSRILYVELLSPDGIVVERQKLLIDAAGNTDGDFVLRDSLYSGFYELRAYTRWMLNFNTSEHKYHRWDAEKFYNFEMAHDFFRMWDGLYSRVLPVYSKPAKEGDYDGRYMYSRPKTRTHQPKPENLTVKFYPEGGHLISGVPTQVAFEAVDQLGQAVDISGTLGEDGTVIKTEHMGRGSFTVTPGKEKVKAYFTWRNKKYSFALPEAEEQGVAVKMGTPLHIYAKGLASNQLGLSVLCRGSLKLFKVITLKADGSADITLPTDSLPTGVNELTVFDINGQILADRLFFVNHHDYDNQNIVISGINPEGYKPLEKIELQVQCPGTTGQQHLALAVRDAHINELTYNDGNIMTDLLLSSELKGFIAYPAYYFEKDDARHQRDLDLLMQVQGWRKYNWKQLADTARSADNRSLAAHCRYAPERSVTIEGTVYKMIGVYDVEPDELPNWRFGVTTPVNKDENEESDAPAGNGEVSSSALNGLEMEEMHQSSFNDPTQGMERIGTSDSYVGVNHSNIKKDVLVESEISVGNQVVGGITKTKNGRFRFNIPAFYGDAYLFMKAYNVEDSLRKCMANAADKHKMDENYYSDYYVKQDLFYPVFAKKYSYYQCHLPEFQIPLVSQADTSFFDKDDHLLRSVEVKAKRRRSTHAIDYTKPALVVDAYEIYNEATDRGLSFGKFNMRQFPIQICTALYGNANLGRQFNIDGRLNNDIFYRNYTPYGQFNSSEKSHNSHLKDIEELHMSSVAPQMRSNMAMFKYLHLNKLNNIYIYTDFEPRNEDDSLIVDESYRASMTVVFDPMPNDSKRYTYRDRRIVYHGFYNPDAYYQPDYSQRPAKMPKDYRRTLYWNPNVTTDEEGNYTATFFNNARETRIQVEASGIGSNGELMTTR